MLSSTAFSRAPRLQRFLRYVVQASLRDSRITDRLAAVDLDREVALAIDASGWLGQEFAARKDF